MGIIDVHHHWVNEPDYLDRLLVEMDRLGIERAGLIAMGRPFQRLFLTAPEPTGCVNNPDVVDAVAARPDRFFGYGFLRLGQDGPELAELPETAKARVSNSAGMIDFMAVSRLKGCPRADQ